MAFIINNVGGYNSAAQTITVTDTTGLVQGKFYGSADAEHVVIMEIISGTSLKILRGVNATVAGSLSDGQVLPEVLPQSSVVDDMQSADNWVDLETLPGLITRDVSGTTFTLSSGTQSGTIYFKVPVTNWTTIRAYTTLTQNALNQFWFGVTKDNPQLGFLGDVAPRVVDAYAIEDLKNRLDFHNYVAGVDFFLAANSNQADLADGVREIIFTKQGSGIQIFEHALGEDMREVGSAVVSLLGDIFFGLGANQGAPVMSDFSLEVFGGDISLGVDKMYRVKVNYTDVLGREQSEIQHHNDTNQDNVYAAILANVALIGGILNSVVWLAAMPVYMGAVGANSRLYYVDVYSQLKDTDFTAKRTRLIIADDLATALADAQTQATTDGDTVLKIELSILDPEGDIGEYLYSMLGFNSVDDYRNQIDTSPIFRVAVPFNVTIDNGAGFSPSNTSWDVDSTDGIVAGDILVTPSNELVLVGNVASNSTLNGLTRGYLGSTAAGVSDNDPCYLVRP